MYNCLSTRDTINDIDTYFFDTTLEQTGIPWSLNQICGGYHVSIHTHQPAIHGYTMVNTAMGVLLSRSMRSKTKV